MSKKKLAFASAAFTALAPSLAFAQEIGSNTFDVQSMAAISGGIAIGLAVLGGATGQGRAAAAALEGISRNPGAAGRIQTPMILGLALIESLVLFAFGIAFLLYGRVPAVLKGSYFFRNARPASKSLWTPSSAIAIAIKIQPGMSRPLARSHAPAITNEPQTTAENTRRPSRSAARWAAGSEVWIFSRPKRRSSSTSWI